MKNILINQNNGDPIYIALSEEMTFNVIYQGISHSAHNSIGMAIEYAASELIGSEINNMDDWGVVQA